jgi:flagellar M-ring protein FliF
MKQIEDLVKSAIGFDARRGDTVQVDSLAFARIAMGDGTPAPMPFLGLDGADWFKLIEAAILSLTALLIGLFVARPLIARMFAPLSVAVSSALPGSPAMGQLGAPHGEAMIPVQQITGAGQQFSIGAPSRSTIDVSQVDGQVRESSIKKVGEVVNAHPEEALAIIRTWLHEPA